MIQSLSIDCPVEGEKISERSVNHARLVLGVAKILFQNGQSTDQTIATAARLARALDLRTTIIPRWGELQLVGSTGDGRILETVAANPTGVDMDRVAAASLLCDDLVEGRRSPDVAMPALKAIAVRPPAPTWQFALAAAAAAVALAVIFGVQHASTAIIIFLSAGAGALLRRRLATLSDNLYLQPFCAALLSGVVGALAVRYQLSSSLRLVAVCPCMVLVPGPHVLNGTMDLIRGRVALGASRLLYATLIITAITAGLLLGFAFFGVSLPVDPQAPAVPLWMDMLASGVAVAGYAVFFSMPPSMMPWPLVAGVVAHGVRWGALELGQGVTMAALLACVVVGVALTPIARHRHMPFAAIGFAAVVSMIPGVFIFRMASGLLQVAADPTGSSELLADAIGNGITATTMIAAMSLGLIIPKLIIDRLDDSSFGKGARP
jgi:uncharacterized membrane protein YjjP (DUF1212 family)